MNTLKIFKASSWSLFHFEHAPTSRLVQSLADLGLRVEPRTSVLRNRDDGDVHLVGRGSTKILFWFTTCGFESVFGLLPSRGLDVAFPNSGTPRRWVCRVTTGDRTQGPMQACKRMCLCFPVATLAITVPAMTTGKLKDKRTPKYVSSLLQKTGAFWKHCSDVRKVSHRSRRPQGRGQASSWNPAYP